MVKIQGLTRKKIDNPRDLAQKIIQKARESKGERTSLKDFLFKEMKI